VTGVAGTPIEVLAVLFGVALGAVAAWKPAWSFGVLLAASVAVEVVHAGTDAHWQYVPWLIPAAVAVVQAMRRHLSAPHAGTLVKWAAAYALWVLAVALIHHASGDLPYAAGVPVVMVVALWALPRISAATGADAWTQFLRVTATLTALMSFAAGVAALAFHQGFPVPVGHRILLAWQWPFANKNTLGFLAAFGVPAAIATLVECRGRQAWWWWVVAVLAVVGLGLSYARTAWVAAAVGSLVVVAVAYGRRGLWGGMLGVVAAFLLVAAKTGVHRLAALFGHGLSGRTKLWGAALQAARAHVVFGVGPGQSPAALTPLVPPAFAGLTPSNAVLETLVELGAVGVALWIAVLAAAVATAWQRAASLQRFGLWAALAVAGLVEQMGEASFLGGISFEDYLFLALLVVVITWPDREGGARTP
jgi:putative inorganic carbon (HCO3(-)) transporter